MMHYQKWPQGCTLSLGLKSLNYEQTLQPGCASVVPSLNIIYFAKLVLLETLQRHWSQTSRNTTKISKRSWERGERKGESKDVTSV